MPCQCTIENTRKDSDNLEDNRHDDEYKFKQMREKACSLKGPINRTQEKGSSSSLSTTTSILVEL